MILEYQDVIFYICYKFTANYFDAEDLAQDTFLAAYKNYASFDGANERAWLCRIATNKSLDYLKRAGRRSVPTEDVYFSGLSAEGASLEDDVMDREVRRRLWECCNQLKSPYREVAIDYYYHEMEIGDLVKKTGKNIKTLQTQIYRAKGMLRQLYGKEAL